MCESQKSLMKKEKKIEFHSLHEKNFKQKEENNKQTVDDLHHAACFDLQAVLPTATGDISNCCYKSKHFTYSCTVCDRQMEALCDVHCYLWHGVRGNRSFY